MLLEMALAVVLAEVEIAAAVGTVDMTEAVAETGGAKGAENITGVVTEAEAVVVTGVGDVIEVTVEAVTGVEIGAVVVIRARIVIEIVTADVEAAGIQTLRLEIRLLVLNPLAQRNSHLLE